MRNGTRIASIGLHHLRGMTCYSTASLRMVETGAQLRQIDSEMQPEQCQEHLLDTRSTTAISPSAEEESINRIPHLGNYSESMQAALDQFNQGQDTNISENIFFQRANQIAMQGGGECMKDLVQEMYLDGIIPSQRMLSKALEGALASGNILDTLSAVSHFYQHGCEPLTAMYADIILLAAQKKQFAFALQFSEDLLRRGVQFDHEILKALLFCYGKMGKPDKASQILESLGQAGYPMEVDQYVDAIGAVVEAARKAHKRINKEESTRSVEQLFAQACTNINLEEQEEQRDRLLLATMEAYAVFKNYAAASDAYLHIVGKTPGSRSLFISCLVQGSLTNFLEAVESRAGGSQGQAVQDFLQSCTQGLEELSLLSGVGSSCLVVEDACDAIHGLVQFVAHCEQTGVVFREVENGDDPLYLGERILKHLNFAGLAIPSKAGSRIIVSAMESKSKELVDFARKVAKAMERYKIRPLREASILINRNL